MIGKEQIRKNHKALRQQMPASERAGLSARIQAMVLDFLAERPEIRHVHLFLPIERLGEVDTVPLFFGLQQQGYTLYTSSLDPTGKGLLTLDISKVGEFEPDSWGIPQPIGAEFTSPDQIQLVLVPLLAYDMVGHRLGYGKGYYDGFLAALTQPVLKVGLSFFEPVLRIPAEEHDVRLDFCICPSKIHEFHP